MLEDWNCADVVVGMVFDTTASNTGHKTAGCIAVQQQLKKPLLWFACRHHIGEVILSHVWDVLKVEVSKSPEITIFQRFQESFGKFTHGDIAGLQYPRIPNFQESVKSELKNVWKDVLPEDFVQGDYKELVELVLLYISDDHGPSFGSFNHPGALHKARWMSKLLYTTAES